MSGHDQIRLVFIAFTGLAIAGTVYWGALSKSLRADSHWRSARYDPILSPLNLVMVFCILAATGLVMDRNHVLMPLFVSLVLEIAVYYAALLLLLPLLRKVFRPGTVAVLWVLPNILSLAIHTTMLPSEPKAVVLIPPGVASWAVLIWAMGFLAVMGRAVFQHLAYRKELLRSATPITEPEILAIWNEEADAMGLDAAKLALVRSAATVTPLSIGIWRSTTQVVLPEQDYAPEELRLIFRHELIHVRRWDAATKLSLTFCQAACWFNPLMWIAMRKCADDLELGCDELVLTEADSSTREAYARLVLRTAGDERGFTTCLSVRAKSLRYRLRGIVSGRGKLAGGLLAGLLTAALLLGNGLVAVAYAPATGEEAIFHGHSADYAPTRISYTPGSDTYQFSYYTCADVPAFKDYLSELKLYRVSGFYDPPGECLFVSLDNDAVNVRLYDQMVSVAEWDGAGFSSKGLYYSPEPLDLAYLQTLLVEES